MVSRQDVIADITDLRRDYPIDDIPASDRRFGLKVGGGSVADVLVGRGPNGSLPVGEAWGAVQRVGQTPDRITHQTPEEALLELAGALLDHNPNTHAVVKRLGWDGGGGCSVTEAGRLAGVSWQRIGQLEAKLRGRVTDGWYFLPEGAERYIGATETNLHWRMPHTSAGSQIPPTVLGWTVPYSE